MTRIAATSLAGLLGLGALMSGGPPVAAQTGGVVCRSGNLNQVSGTFERFFERREVILVVPRGPVQAFPCKQVRGVLYTGARALMADCRPGMQFSTSGSLRAAPGGGFIVEAPVIACKPANAPTKNPAPTHPPILNPEPDVNPFPRQPGKAR